MSASASDLYAQLGSMMFSWQQYLDQQIAWQAGPDQQSDTSPPGGDATKAGYRILTDSAGNQRLSMTPAQMSKIVADAVSSITSLNPSQLKVDFEAWRNDAAQINATLGSVRNTLDSLVASASSSKDQAATSAANAATSASTSTSKATIATTSATNAATSATNAATSATSAQNWASAAVDTIVGSGKYSAMHYATKASESMTAATTKASEAATSASTAATKASEASVSSSNASTKASEAAASASTASTKASEAAASATTATTKASEASTSAATATTKASEASTSATTSQNWATTAVDVAVTTGKYSALHHATKAAASATAAASSATSASSASATATTKASEAATSATTAATKASEAATSATSAATSASAAATKASDAAASATASASSATAAASSATAASSSKDAAATSASNAATSASNAAASATSAANYAQIAQQSATVSTGALIEAGSVSMAAGTYPPPLKDANNVNLSCFWKVTTAGIGPDSVDYGVGDTLVYSSTLAAYYKIDNTESVTSVNGLKGAVVLTHANVGALAAGANAVSASKWAAARTVTLGGDATGSVSIDGSANVTLTVAVVDDSHQHTFANLKSLPTTLAGFGITDAQPFDADLSAIAALAGTSGFLKKTATNTWALDTNTYLTANQTITVSGDATGSGGTAIALTLANSGVAAGTYNNSATAHTPFTVDAKGRVTSVGSAVTITPAWGSITGKPTTIAGYGITDALLSSGGSLTGSLTMAMPTDHKAIIFNNINTAMIGVSSNRFISYLNQDTMTAWAWRTTQTDTGTGVADIMTLSKAGALAVSASVTAPTFVGALSGNAATATKLATARTITLTGGATGSFSFDGSSNVSMPVTVPSDGHQHSFSSLSGRPTTLAGYGITDAAPAGYGLGGSSYAARGSLNTFRGNGWQEYNADAGDTDGPGGYGNVLHIGQIGNAVYFAGWASQLFVSTNGAMYIRTNTAIGSFAGSAWNQLYTSLHKPSAADLGVVSLAGSTMTGPLNFAYNNASACFLAGINETDGWTWIKMGKSAQANQGHFAWNTLSTEGHAANSFHFRPNGSKTILAISPGFASVGSDAYLEFLGNSTWGGKLRVGGNGRTASNDGLTASVTTTNGNLHLDAASGDRGVYLGFYAGTAGIKFGNGAGATIGSVDAAGNMSMNGAITAGTFYGSLSGNASTASKLSAVRTISATGDAAWSVSFDGSGNATAAITLATTGVVSGTYTKLTVDTKGRVTAGSLLTAADVPALDWSKIASGKPTTIAGYGITDAYSKSGGTISGSVDVSGSLSATGNITALGQVIAGDSASAAYVNLNSAAGFNAVVYGRRGTLKRWGIYLGDSSSESGSNAGGNFRIFRFNDDGTTIGSVLDINRATGAVDITTSLTVQGKQVLGGLPNPTLVWSGSVATNGSGVSLTGLSSGLYVITAKVASTQTVTFLLRLNSGDQISTALGSLIPAYSTTNSAYAAYAIYTPSTTAYYAGVFNVGMGPGGYITKIERITAS